MSLEHKRCGTAVLFSLDNNGGGEETKKMKAKFYSASYRIAGRIAYMHRIAWGNSVRKPGGFARHNQNTK